MVSQAIADDGWIVNVIAVILIAQCHDKTQIFINNYVSVALGVTLQGSGL